jgi:hypothetical protein
MFRSLYVIHCKGALDSGEGHPYPLRYFDIFEKHNLSEFDHSSKCAAKTSYGLTCSEHSSLKIHIFSDVRRGTYPNDRYTSFLIPFVAKHSWQSVLVSFR